MKKPKKPKKPKPDFSNTRTLRMRVNDVATVDTRVAEDGRPLTSGVGYWIGTVDEKIAPLANVVAWNALANAARTLHSADTRRAAAEEHWTSEWLRRAYRPGMSRVALAEAAQKQYKLNEFKIDAEKCAEINEHRARKYLESLRNTSAG